MKRLLPLLVILVLSGVPASRAEIEFTGVVSGPQSTRVYLSDSATTAASWLSIGESFSGYVIARFEPATNTLVLTRNGTELRLRLKDAAVARGTEPVPEPDPATVDRAVLNNLRQIAAAAQQYFLENGVDRVTLDRLVGPDRYIKELRVVAGEDYSKLELAQGGTLTMTLSNGHTISYKR